MKTYLLLTTTHCPKCPAVKSFVAENISFPGEIMDETSQGFMEKVQSLGVTSAPAFFIFENDQEVFRGSELSEIQDFLNKI